MFEKLTDADFMALEQEAIHIKAVAEVVRNRPLGQAERLIHYFQALLVERHPDGKKSD